MLAAAAAEIDSLAELPWHAYPHVHARVGSVGPPLACLCTCLYTCICMCPYMCLCTCRCGYRLHVCTHVYTQVGVAIARNGPHATTTSKTRTVAMAALVADTSINRSTFCAHVYIFVCRMSRPCPMALGLELAPCPMALGLELAPCPMALGLEMAPSPMALGLEMAHVSIACCTSTHMPMHMSMPLPCHAHPTDAPSAHSMFTQAFVRISRHTTHVVTLLPTGK